MSLMCRPRNTSRYKKKLERSASGLTTNEKKELYKLLLEYFAESSAKLGCTNLIKHSIDVGITNTLFGNHVDECHHSEEGAGSRAYQGHAQNFIQLSFSPWASPVVLVGKRDGSLRFCVDWEGDMHPCMHYTARKDAYPLPRGG